MTDSILTQFPNKLPPAILSLDFSMGQMVLASSTVSHPAPRMNLSEKKAPQEAVVAHHRLRSVIKLCKNISKLV